MWSESYQSLRDNLRNDSILTQLRPSSGPLQHKETTKIMTKGVGKRPSHHIVERNQGLDVAFGNCGTSLS